MKTEDLIKTLAAEAPPRVHVERRRLLDRRPGAAGSQAAWAQVSCLAERFQAPSNDPLASPKLPWSILHDCAHSGDFEGAQFLLAHGADPTIHDRRWDATAAGWARYAAKDEAMATMLYEAEERRRPG